jgi:hypothetical protein
MIMRNVISTHVHRRREGDAFSGGDPTITEMLLDCGHTLKRLGDLSSRKRMLCSNCSAAITERTQVQMARGA